MAANDPKWYDWLDSFGRWIWDHLVQQPEYWPSQFARRLYVLTLPFSIVIRWVLVFILWLLLVLMGLGCVSYEGFKKKIKKIWNGVPPNEYV